MQDRQATTWRPFSYTTVSSRNAALLVASASGVAG